MRDSKFDQQSALQKLSRTRFATFLVLCLENITESFWRITSWILLFSGLWLLQLPVVFGEAAIFATAILFFIGVGYFAYKDIRFFKWPDKNSIDRRIEQASALKHHPLSVIGDRLANPSKQVTQTLWNQNLDQAHKILKQVKAAKPKSFMARLDPYALRLGVILFFGLGFFISGADWKERIFEGALPFSFLEAAESQDKILATITPPDYTKINAFTLDPSREKTDQTALEIPDGSILKIRMKGGLGTPYLIIGEESWAFSTTDDGRNRFIEMPLPDAQNIEVQQFLITKARWDYKIVPDTPPVINKAEDHEILDDGTLRFPITVQDDYGVQTLSMRMELDADIDSPPIGNALAETRSVSSPPGQAFSINPIYDLTYHSWAGLPVVFTFEAADFKDQKAALEPIRLVLPEREFEHPVAKALIEIRQKLAWAPLEDYELLSESVTALLAKPKSYQDDKIVFLSLRSIASRLYWSKPSMETAKDLISQLWDTALHIEDGNLDMAARNLRQAQRNLEEAMRNPDSTPSDITQAMNELREAMAEYFMEMQKELQKRVENGEPLPMISPDMMLQDINPDALAGFLDELEQRMLSGDIQSAEEMMAELQQFMDMMQPLLSQPFPRDMQMMNKGINELQELIDRQKDLLEQTRQQVMTLEQFQNLNQGIGEFVAPESELMQEWGLNDLPPAPTIDPESRSIKTDTSEHKTEQEALRFILGQLMLDAAEALDEIPETMGLAEQEMRSSSKYLGENVPEGSIPHQEQAIEYLEQAQKDLQEQLSKRMKQMVGFTMSGGGMRYDPLGRPYGGEDNENGLFPGSKIKIPNEAEKKRANEILRLLRRRSGELNRPDDELDYFRRLLRQF